MTDENSDIMQDQAGEGATPTPDTGIPGMAMADETATAAEQVEAEAPVVEPPAVPEVVVAEATAPPAPPAPMSAAPAEPVSPVAPPPPTASYAPPTPTTAAVASDKNKVVAGVLGILLGALGIHKFYLGYNKEGIIMLAVTVVGGLITFGIASSAMSIIGIVEGVLYLVKTDEEFDATYVAGSKPWF